MIPRSIPLKSEELFRLAVKHRSASKADTVSDSYERLEFFGDSLLGFIIAQYLFEQHPTWDQGMLSKAKSSVVQEGPLAETSERLGLAPYLELSPSEESTGGRNKPSILADVLEAIIGAIYLESGLETARWFVLEQLRDYLLVVATGDVSPNDFKSKLQEAAQANWRRTPNYKVVGEHGSGQERRFVVQVLFDNEVLGEGSGRSKKEAEQSAACEALKLIQASRQLRPESSLDDYDF